MKQWILPVCFGLLFFSFNTCNSAPGIVLEKVTLDLKSTEDEQLQEKLNINSYVRWEWLELGLVNKLTYPQESDDYHNLKLKFGFPKLVNGLGVDLDCDWNSRYRVINAGMDYTWKPLKGLKLLCETKVGSKSPMAVNSEPYRNDWDYQKIYLGYNVNNWSYKLGCDRTQKSYPESDYLTSTKYNLEQELARQLTPKFKLGLTYHEATGDYPYDMSLGKNYWKEDWVLWGKLRQGKNQHWNWKYRTLVWDKGYAPYQDNSYVTADYQWWSKRWRFDAALSWSDLKYLTETPSYDPDEEVDESEDYQSREEKKVSFEVTRYFKDVQWGTELFSVHKDYIIGDTESHTGIITKIIWEIGKYKIRFNIAPFGNGSNTKDYYQIKLEYNPKDVIE